MATNTFVGTKNIVPEQNPRPSQRPIIQTKFFNGTKSISGTVEDASSPGEPLAGRVLRLFTAAGILISETTSASDGTYSFPNLSNDINDIADGLIVTKQRPGLDGYAQMRDRLVAV